ncbi:MAG TPA: F0F1 ATP synthase subunit A [Acidimicrobiales bacterium]|nr:F0F1 ATP synthase subunit A [Acidimicrobiales bacterium]
MGAGSFLLKAPLLATNITVGEHPTAKLGPLTVNVDIVWATIIAGLVVVLLGMILRSKATSGVPGKFQLAWELAVSSVQRQVDESIGPRGAKVVPLALTLFIFIFICNLFEVVGIGSRYEFLPAPTSDINLPLAMALYVFVLTNLAAVRNRGLRGYLAHYVKQPFKPWLAPVNLFMNGVEEIIKPLTLTLRLFGNLLAGGLMLSLLAALVIWKLGPLPIGGLVSIPFTVVWKLFDLAIGAIQAFIFALLTVVYFDAAMATDEAH